MVRLRTSCFPLVPNRRYQPAVELCLFTSPRLDFRKCLASVMRSWVVRGSVAHTGFSILPTSVTQTDGFAVLCFSGGELEKVLPGARIYVRSLISRPQFARLGQLDQMLYTKKSASVGADNTMRILGIPRKEYDVSLCHCAVLHSATAQM